MLQREYRDRDNSRDFATSYKSPTATTARVSVQNSYVLAMKALQDKIRLMENERVQTPQEDQRALEVQQLKQQLHQLQRDKESLQLQHSRTLKQDENLQSYTMQIESLQQERLQHLKDYQERVSELIRKNEELRKDKTELTSTVDHLNRQLQAYKANERAHLHKAELIKFEEHAKLSENVHELRQKLDSNDQFIRKLEKRVEKLQQDKLKVENEFMEYRDKYPQFKISEYEKQILQLRCQLEEKENQYLKNLDEIQTNRQAKEEQLSRRVQDLLNRSNELQTIIHQQTMDYKDLTMKYQQTKLRLEYEDKSRRQRKYSQQEETETNMKVDRTVSRLNLEMLSPQITSPRFQSQNQHSSLKQMIKESLEEIKQQTPFNNRAEQTQPIKKKLISPPLTARNLEFEGQLKQSNDRYEMLIRQAQKETDFKQKALIRKELLALAEQIKELNKQR